MRVVHSSYSASEMFKGVHGHELCVTSNPGLTCPISHTSRFFSKVAKYNLGEEGLDLRLAVCVCVCGLGHWTACV